MATTWPRCCGLAGDASASGWHRLHRRAALQGPRAAVRTQGSCGTESNQGTLAEADTCAGIVPCRRPLQESPRRTCTLARLYSTPSLTSPATCAMHGEVHKAKEMAKRWRVQREERGKWVEQRAESGERNDHRGEMRGRSQIADRREPRADMWSEKRDAGGGTAPAIACLHPKR